MRLSMEALQLLRSVEQGGVPAFVSERLQKIAEQHGIEVTSETTPNEIVEALRALQRTGVGQTRR
jgi:predicted RNase H-like nuclease (RuvC/YqgF family)